VSTISETTQSSGQEDRRSSNRQLCNLPVVCRPLSSGSGSFPGVVRDITPEGVGMSVDQEVPYQTICVSLQNAQGTFAVTKVARVKYQRAERTGQWSFGVSFVKKLTKDEIKWLMDAD
jgi:hypothetical protein